MLISYIVLRQIVKTLIGMVQVKFSSNKFKCENRSYDQKKKRGNGLLNV